MAGCSGCAHDLIGWRREAPAQPFMRLVTASAPPPLPPLVEASSEAQLKAYLERSPCGARLEDAGTFCSLCFHEMQ